MTRSAILDSKVPCMSTNRTLALPERRESELERVSALRTMVGSSCVCGLVRVWCDRKEWMERRLLTIGLIASIAWGDSGSERHISVHTASSYGSLAHCRSNTAREATSSVTRREDMDSKLLRRCRGVDMINISAHCRSKRAFLPG